MIRDPCTPTCVSVFGPRVPWMTEHDQQYFFTSTIPYIASINLYNRLSYFYLKDLLLYNSLFLSLLLWKYVPLVSLTFVPPLFPVQV